MVEKYGLGWVREVDEAIEMAGRCGSSGDRVVRVVPGLDEVIYKESELREVPDNSNWARLRRLEDRVWLLERRLRKHVFTIDYLAHKRF